MNIGYDNTKMHYFLNSRQKHVLLLNESNTENEDNINIAFFRKDSALSFSNSIKYDRPFVWNNQEQLF